MQFDRSLAEHVGSRVAPVAPVALHITAGQITGTGQYLHASVGDEMERLSCGQFRLRLRLLLATGQASVDQSAQDRSMSASIGAMTWKFPSACPNCLRVFACSRARSTAARRRLRHPNWACSCARLSAARPYAVRRCCGEPGTSRCHASRRRAARCGVRARARLGQGERKQQFTVDARQTHAARIEEPRAQIELGRIFGPMALTLGELNIRLGQRLLHGLDVAALASGWHRPLAPQ